VGENGDVTAELLAEKTLGTKSRDERASEGFERKRRERRVLGKLEPTVRRGEPGGEKLEEGSGTIRGE